MFKKAKKLKKNENTLHYKNFNLKLWIKENRKNKLIEEIKSCLKNNPEINNSQKKLEEREKKEEKRKNQMIFQ